jgi:parvulin-like peptidyl-prolyl isomerase
MLLNVGFGLTVVAALLLLVIAFASSWYGEHLAPAATVNGQTISKDAHQRQLAVNEFRLDYQTRRIRTLLTAGRIRPADAEQRLASLEQFKGQASTVSLEQLIDGRIMDQLAAEQGVTVSDADIDARITEEATTPELRRAWMIAVEPELADGESVPTDAAVAAAKAKAAQALADLKAGKDWETVAKAVSTDATRDQAGDLGFIDQDASLDAPFLAALQAAAADVPTEVVEGEDGIFRVGRVTEIVPSTVDATLEQQAQDEGVGREDFRAAMRMEVVREKLSQAVLAPLLVAGPQREVQEIWMKENPSESGPKAVKIRHILYSPNDNSGAADLAPDDPAWSAAEAEAKATYDRLKADPSLFDSIARAETDDPGSKDTGGKYWFSLNDQLLPEFGAAIFKPGLEPGQLLEPVKTDAGWHVIQILHYPTDVEWANELKTRVEGGTDFGTLVRDNSDRADVADDGNIGWVGKGQLAPELEAALFSAKAGEVADPVKVDGDGVYLYRVIRELTREPDDDQRAQLEGFAFPRWYGEKKAGFVITREAASDSPAGG